MASLQLIFDAIAFVLAIILNSIAMDGVVHSNITLTGYRRFLISLLLSDIYICVVKVLFFARQAAAYFTDLDPNLNKCFHKMERSLEMTGFIAFMLNLSGMFFDHFIGIVYPVRYRELMNTHVARSFVFIIWTVALLIGLADHPIGTSIEYYFLTSQQNSTMNRAAAAPSSLISVSNCSFSPTQLPDYNTAPAVVVDSAERMTLSFGSGEDFIAINYTHFSSVTTAATPQNITAPVIDYHNIGLNRTAVEANPDCDIETVLDAFVSFVHESENSAAGNSATSALSWCALYDSNYHVILDWVVIGLAIGTVIFMAICNAVFSRKIRKISTISAGRTKSRMRKLVVTTLLLLGLFSICWLPFVGYEITMLLITQYGKFGPDEPIISVDASMTIHYIFYALFMCSPLVAPFVFVFRISAVKRSLMRRHASCFWLGNFGSEVVDENAAEQITLMPSSKPVAAA